MSSNRRMPSAEPRCLLECVRHLQYGEILPMPPNDLHPHREAFRSESARYGSRGIAGR